MIKSNEKPVGLNVKPLKESMYRLLESQNEMRGRNR